ncbi:MAG: pilus assembly protein TadG-related protein [Acidimicrobiia bacterium]
MRELIKKAWKQDRGAALAIIATSMFLLMGVAAISADLAWYYLNTSRVQRTADAAALAGVVYLPHETATANSTAIDIANRNGYDNTLADVSVTPTVISENQLQVRVSDEVDTFFAKVLGWNSMTIARTAVAEYIPPLKLGSPENQFGNDCDPGQPGCPPQTANFWANIHGKWTQRSMGDAYSSWCTNAPDNPGCNQNPFARSTGYLYGIESPGSFTVEFNDLAFHNTSGGNPTGDYIRTGDRGCEDWGPSTAADCGPTMVVTLYGPDPTPLDVSNNPVLCTATIPPLPQVPETDPYDWLRPDQIPGATSDTGCWTQSGDGYILQVRHLDPGNTTNRAGLNRYGVRANGGAGTNLFALGDFSIYNNFSGSTTSFHLAEVPTYYHGKTFVVELFDAGESAANGTLQVIDPTGSVFDDGECRIYSRNNPASNWSLQTTISAGGDCQELVTPGEYNDRWLKFEMDLSPTYSCTNCWWKMNYVYTSPVNDTTTWRAYMIGNPIHIID